MKKIITINILLAGISFFAGAQKLPATQKISLWAPANIKIDGKTTEWNDQFQAHNSGNHIYYTISNDGTNLYLTAQMEDIDGSRKIFKGGITFTILPLSKKADKLSITFPVIKKTGGLGGGNPLSVYGKLKSDTVANKAKIDSLISSSNMGIMKSYNEIHVTGIPEINDPFLSINNTLGIMVGASFDKKMRYTYELAIPLKYLEGTISNVKSIRYNIQLNIFPIMPVKPSVQSLAPPLELQYAGPGSINDIFKYDNSDFSGVYTLAIK